jgi:hypothetical protein
MVAISPRRQLNVVVALHDVDLDLALARREEGALLDTEL